MEIITTITKESLKSSTVLKKSGRAMAPAPPPFVGGPEADSVVTHDMQYAFECYYIMPP